MDLSRIIVIGVVAAVCLLVAVFFKNRRAYLLFALIFLCPLSIGWVFRHNNGVFLVDIPLALLLLYALVTGQKLRFYWKIPVLGFTVWCLLTGLLAERFDIVFSELTRFIRGYLAFVCIVSLTHNKKDISALFYAIIVSFGMHAFIGFLEWRFGFLGLRFLGEDSFLYRAGGLFVHPNIFGDFLIWILPMILRLFAFYRHPKRSYNIMFGALFMLGLAALLATLARGAWLSFAGAVILMLLYSLFKRKFYPKVVGAAAFLVLLATVFAIHYTPTITIQFESEWRGRASSVRMPLNRIALRMIKDHPITGTGLGNYTLHTHPYAVEEESEEHHYWELLQIVHNSYLLYLAECGIPGFLFIILIFAMVFKAGLKALKTKNSFISNLSLGLLTGYVAILVACLAGPDFRNHQMTMLFWILAGFLVNLGRFKSGKVAPKKVSPAKVEDQLARQAV